VALSLIGTGLKAPTQLYIGWFGPRGLASLVFMGTVVVESEPEFAQAIVAVAATTVGLSVLLHGVTAWPGSVRYAAWFKRSVDAPDAVAMQESKEVTHVPTAPLGTRIRPPLEPRRKSSGS